MEIEENDKSAWHDGYLKGIANKIVKKAQVVVNQSYTYGGQKRERIKWYDESQKEAMLQAFHTIRDKAIFAVTLDGFRIDEVLSSRLGDYNVRTGILTPYRSKGKEDDKELRAAPLSERSVKLLQDYMLNERSKVENTLTTVSDYIFVNLKNTSSYGQPVTYRNFEKIIKRAAKRAGFDPAYICTHSGRATRANELYDYVLDGKITEQKMMSLMGWKRTESMQPYINAADKKRMVKTQKQLEKMDQERIRKWGETTKQSQTEQ